MSTPIWESHRRRVAPRAGQVVLEPLATVEAPTDQVRQLNRISDPALSELDLDALLDELLERVREILSVDTVAILLYEKEEQKLVARAAKGLEEEVERGIRIPVGVGFAGRIAAERVSVFIADVDHADILNPILRQKGIRSLLGVPLIVEGELIGVLHVGSMTPRTFDQRDLAILQLAAARAAPAIERARLFAALEREHHVAMVLQQSLLPRTLPDVVGVSVAARYMAARNEVGGDWYDVIELPRGRIGMVIGDVVGHGTKAAALMGQMRTALRSYAGEGHAPARVLELVDRFVQNSPDSPMATAIYAVLDLETDTLRIANAGHLPPIVVSAAGVRELPVTPSPPLGAFPYSSRSEQAFDLGSGETVVLYTDGLVERRGISLTERIAELCDTLAGTEAPEDACVAALRALVPAEGSADDVAILALRNEPVEDELRLLLPARPEMLSQVRHAIRRWLRHCGADRDALTEVTMAASEACANAIEHAYSPAPATFELEGSFDGEEITLVIRDKGRWRAPRGSNRGRGLTIMERAMDEVRIEPAESGTEILMRRRVAA